MTFGGLLGIMLHSLVSVRSINKRVPNANFKMIFKEYWANEWMSIASSVFCFAVLLFVASEFVNLEKVDTPDYTESLKDRLVHFKLSQFIKVTSVIAGYFSDSIIYGFLGVTEKRINDKLKQIENDK